MIVAKNIGQAGNNLFQISAAIGYARKYGYQWAVDPGHGQGEPYSKIHECFPNLPKGDLSGVRYHEHPHGICPQHGVSYDLCHYDYHDIPNLGPNVVMTGFFQSWKYFKDVQDEVRKVFELPHVPGYEDYVSIHVRRGDYLQHSQSFPPVTFEYIHAAYTKMVNMLPGGVDRKYIFFSDDIPWCKQTFGHWSNVEFSEGRSTLEDWSLMASCGHHIIANSSYSYWGAMLGHNPDRVIICPSVKRGSWYGLSSGVQRDCVDLVPNDWHQITFR